MCGTGKLGEETWRSGGMGDGGQDVMCKRRMKVKKYQPTKKTKKQFHPTRR